MLPALRGLRRLIRSEVRVLAYHRVLDIGDGSAFDFDPALVSASPDAFREQMRLMSRRFRPMTCADVAAIIDAGKPMPANAVVVTFDDGYDDNYRFAFPILRELGIPATFFVSTGHIDNGLPYAYDWLAHMIYVATAATLDVPELELRVALPDSREGRRVVAADLLDRIKWLDGSVQGAIIARLERDWSMPRTPHPDCRPMIWSQLREMHAAGMEIGSHGIHHRMLARLPREEMIEEVRGSSAALARELGAPPKSISYPVGGPNAYNDDVIAAVRDAGFRVAFSYISGTNPQPIGNRYAMRRLPVEYEMDQGWFAGMITFPELFSYPTRLRIG